MDKRIPFKKVEPKSLPLGKKVLVLGTNNLPFHRIDMAGPILSKILNEAQFETIITQNLDMLKAENLGEFDILLNYYTKGNLDMAQIKGLLSFVNAGGGLMGLHSAADSFRDSAIYLELLGGIFRRHPPHQKFNIRVSNQEHPITKGISDFEVYDELYILHHDPDLYNLLLYCDWENKRHPVAWTREHGRGKVFYLSLGHTKEALTHPTFQKILVRGMNWLRGI